MDGNILKYKAFIETVHQGSFSKAAENLHYSQSGISRMISDLEKEWALTLLERGRGGVQLTAEGKSLLPKILQLCTQYDELRNQIDRLHGLESGLLRIGTFSSVAVHWLPPVIKRFQHDYPGIDYELLTGEYSRIEQWIMDGRVDLGFVLLPVRQELSMVSVYQDELLAILPEGHPLEGYQKVPLEVMADYNFMLRETAEKAEISPLFEAEGIRPNIQFTTYDDYAILSMVENGLGISILPQLILNRIPYRVVTRSLEPPAYRRIGLALKDKENAPLAVKRFLEYLSEKTKA
ncbi:MAG: LysR family transcriptional regulator [Emergencia sp.]|nr:LysR family transcriptional regulator [Emergencia sp.]